MILRTWSLSAMRLCALTLPILVLGFTFAPPSTAQTNTVASAQTQALNASAFRINESKLTQGGWLRGHAPSNTISLTLNGNDVPFQSDTKAFFIGFDRDFGPEAVLIAQTPYGPISSQLAITPRPWRLQHIKTPMRPSSMPSAEYQRIRTAERARIDTARTRPINSQGWTQRFIWPAQGRTSGVFGSQRIYAGQPGSYHSGLDIANTTGTPFIAPADGVVILATNEPFTLEGKLLMVDHGMGLSSAFLHASELLVREGETVRQGQVIGRIGSTGRSSGPHLH